MKIAVLIISFLLFLPTTPSYATAIADAKVTMDVTSLTFGGIDVYWYDDNPWWNSETELSTSAHSKSDDGTFVTDNDNVIHRYSRFIALETGEFNFSVTGNADASASGETNEDTAYANALFGAFVESYIVSKDDILKKQVDDSVGYITSLTMDVSGPDSKSDSKATGGSEAGLIFQEGQQGYFTVILDPVTEAKGFVPAPLPIILLGSGLMGIVVFRKMLRC